MLILAQQLPGKQPVPCPACAGLLPSPRHLHPPSPALPHMPQPARQRHQLCSPDRGALLLLRAAGRAAAALAGRRAVLQPSPREAHCQRLGAVRLLWAGHQQQGEQLAGVVLRWGLPAEGWEGMGSAVGGHQPGRGQGQAGRVLSYTSTRYLFHPLARPTASRTPLPQPPVPAPPQATTGTATAPRSSTCCTRCSGTRPTPGAATSS